MTSDAANGQLESRRAIEALRNGVPNDMPSPRLALGKPRLKASSPRCFSVPRHDNPAEGVGMLAAGDFGTGKSHLLRHLQTIALENNFACSYVVVSKETPLFDMGKVFSAAIQHGRLPDAAGHMVEEAALKLRPDSEAYAKFFLWANSLRVNCIPSFRLPCSSKSSIPICIGEPRLSVSGLVIGSRSAK